jgi:hypothetical protein
MFSGITTLSSDFGIMQGEREEEKKTIHDRRSKHLFYLLSMINTKLPWLKKFHQNFPSELDTLSLCKLNFLDGYILEIAGDENAIQQRWLTSI